MASRPSNPKHAGRHEWNTYQDYKQVNERKLAEYTFIQDSEIAFVEIDHEGNLFIQMDAILRLPKNVILEVTKLFETMRKGPGQGRLYVRGISYRYNAWIEGKHNILRYDNGHDLDEYHGHRWDRETGEAIEKRSMSRDEFPLFTEVIDEIDEIMGYSESAQHG